MKIAMKPETHFPDNHVLLSDVTSLEAADPAGKEGDPEFPR